jgi:hypothetical protein
MFARASHGNSRPTRSIPAVHGDSLFGSRKQLLKAGILS